MKYVVPVLAMSELRYKATTYEQNFSSHAISYAGDNHFTNCCVTCGLDSNCIWLVR
jgi:hypothetical protein